MYNTHVALVADLNVQYSPHLDKPNWESTSQSIMKKQCEMEQSLHTQLVPQGEMSRHIDS